ncbi:L-2-hydroxyglutarate oxidase [Paraburkholderia sp. BL6665CI2N2]|uniref:L-2-hydroxyglutarate oxidase n=1 Tax=Paraburkholderia sp. BL6665CI2N2 TaxID=1938806 RepID=UPI001066E203|nr:L-2-hydroxyglutarate oxidase [Paraburkholderia sp. BL6665CI2N2]TDY16803.1 L-2-hydroxyglutarate oxidase [Paraburkholderia sp. BL6665CI2N2]
MIYDYCVVGGGIVGLATAMKLLEKQPGASLVLLEKEPSLGKHQTGHNSGVIHAGIYYTPGSLKAELCRLGSQATKDFCTAHAIPFEVCGKLLVATNQIEVARMNALYERSIKNNIKVERLGATDLRRREPNIRGLGALFVESTGIVDYTLVCEALGRVVRSAGGLIDLGVEVTSIQEGSEGVVVNAGDMCWTARHLVACAGLQSDRIARSAGLNIDYRIVPFRGEYYQLPLDRNKIVKSLIYPIPDPELPFLGIHLTRMIDGRVTVGPNAVLGFAREGYPKFSFSLRDVRDYLSFPGFWKVLLKNRKSGATEMINSVLKKGYLRECQKYCPDLKLEDLGPYEAGIRAQAVMRDGTLVHDFLFVETDRMLHVCNAPSPAATSAIPIGEMIADKCISRALVHR